ncbi:hypothetical protein [Rossellomorea aquimaris]|uniref:hypothetical protein n=1 Tax=Rossellomorea aquimaris TaxID=189382 RepID=UPI0005C9A9DD|nr:hypothetical protein [Rossellomorea aquimaris]
MEYRKLNKFGFRLIHKGGIKIKNCMYLIMVVLLLVGCSPDSRDSIVYEKLEVSQEEAVPERILLTREEMDNKKMRYSEVKIAEVGEEAARLSVADSFSGLNDHFSSGVMDVLDGEDNKYRAIYIGENYQENFNAENEYEKAVLKFYRSKDKEDERPFIDFMEMD